jgi:hypothetical protein
MFTLHYSPVSVNFWNLIPSNATENYSEPLSPLERVPPTSLRKRKIKYLLTTTEDFFFEQLIRSYRKNLLTEQKMHRRQNSCPPKTTETKSCARNQHSLQPQPTYSLPHQNQREHNKEHSLNRDQVVRTPHGDGSVGRERERGRPKRKEGRKERAPLKESGASRRPMLWSSADPTPGP